MDVFCITTNNPQFQKLLAESGEKQGVFAMTISKWMTENEVYDRYPTLQELGITVMESIKPGVQELFDSNPELANSVYEALGFEENVKTIDTKKLQSIYNINGSIENYKIIGNNIQIEYVDFDTFELLTKTVKLDKSVYNNEIIKDNNKTQNLWNSFLNKVNESDKGDGYVVYPKTIEYLQKFKEILNNKDYEDFINTFSEFIGEKFHINIKKDSNDNLWLRVQSNNADTTKFYYFKDTDLNNITSQQKQQALQRYSQYLDTIFPDSKVKDIVYHSGAINKNDKFDRLKIGAYSKLDMFYFTSSKYFEKLDTLLDFYKHYFKNYVLEDYFEEVVASNSIQDIISLAEKILGKNNLTIKNNIENSENDYKKHSGKFYGGWFDSIYESKDLLPAILNVKNPITSNVENGYIKNPNTGIKNVGKYPASTYITNKEYDSYFISDNDIGVKNPEQIHILGSNQDIKGFKDFAGSVEDKASESGLSLSSDEAAAYNSLVNDGTIPIKCK